jgi:hypothetical protein
MSLKLGTPDALQVWYSSREEIPYTHRMHSILISLPMEQELGEETYKQVGGSLKPLLY